MKKEVNKRFEYFEKKIKDAEQNGLCADNNAQVEIRRKIKQRWFWINNLFWWAMGLTAGLIISCFYLS